MGIAVLLFICPLLPLGAQDGPRGSPGEIYVPSDREARRHLARARDSVLAGKWDDAARLYDRLLRHPESAQLLVEVGEGHYRSVREVCRERLLSMPSEGQAVYRARVDPEARAALELAQQSGDLAGGRLVVERFPLATAARDALRWYAAYALDHGLHSETSWALSLQLQEGGLSREEEASLSLQLAVCHALSGERGAARAIRDRLGAEATGEVRVGGGSRDGAEFLDELLHGRLEGRGPGGEGGVPDEVGETAPGAAPPWVLLWAHRISDYYQRGELDPQPHVFPATRGGDVYFHDGNHAYRLDLATGRLRWKVRLGAEGVSYRLPRGACPTTLGDGAVFVSTRGEAVTALDPKTGELLWRVEAETIREELLLAIPVRISSSIVHYRGTVFAAATSVHREKQVFLIALDGGTGRPIGSRFVASRSNSPLAEADVLQDGSRIYLLADIGVVAAIDLPEGALRWVRAWEASEGRPSVLREGPTVHILLPLLDRRFEADVASGEVRAEGRAGAATEWLGVLDGELCGISLRGVVLPRRRQALSLWEIESGLSARPAVVGDHLVVPDPSGLVRVEGTGESILLARWGEVTPGNVMEAGGIVLASNSQGLFAYGRGSGRRVEVPDGLPVGELVRRLGDPSWRVREEADERLRAMALDAIPEISRGLVASDAEVRWRTEEIVFSMEQQARIAAWRQKIPPFLLEMEPDLLSLLTHRDRAVRLEGLDTLSSEGGAGIAPVLKDLLEDEDWEIRFGAARGLLRWGDRSGMGILSGSLLSEVPDERRQAVETLGDFGAQGDALLIRPLLEDEEAPVRLAAVRALFARLGTEALESDGGMLLEDPNEFVRLEVVASVRELGGRTARALLRKAMGDASAAVRSEALAGIETHFGPAMADLVAEAILDESPTVSKGAVTIIMNQLNLERDRNRTEVEAPGGKESELEPDPALGEMFPIPPFQEAVESEDEDLRYYVVQILTRMGRGEGTRALIRASGDENPQIRDWALEGIFDLARRGRVPKEQIPALCRLMALEEAKVRYQVIQSLVHLDDPAVLETLIEALDDPEGGVRRWAVRGLDSVADEGCVVPLLAAASGEEEEKATAASRVLRRLPPDRLIPGLILGLDDGALPVRSEAVRLLRELAGKEMGYDPDSQERAAAIREWRSWWYRKTHPEVSAGKVILDLGDPKPRVRYRAAVAAGNLPEEAVIRALLDRLREEEVRWVLDKEVEALRSTTGKTFGYDRKGTEEERRAALVRWIRWGKGGGE